MLTIVTMLGYIPVAIYFNVFGIIVLNSLFLISSILSFYLQANKHHNAAFYSGSFYGLVYFGAGSVFYGLPSNLHFFILIMCLIAIALFKSNLVLRIYISLAIISFFALIIGLENKTGIIDFTEEMKKAQNAVSILNLLFLFLITILFFVFFRRDNLLFQKEILNQNKIIEEKQKEMLDSIHYAKRIQNTLLASKTTLNKNLNSDANYFVFYNPKDIVSGDFYWATEHNNKFYLAVCDCTGHGVPGAFMSLLNIGFLNEAIKEKGVEKPHEVFNYVRERLIHSISSEGQQDGMDGILLCIDKSTKQITYAAANNEPIIISEQKIIELPKDKMPIGKGVKTESFTLYSINVNKGDALYLYTDGYADQFGGLKGKKFKYKQLNELLLSVNKKPMEHQKDEINSVIQTWKGNLEQVDDILIVGIKL
jgi:serine phosphatase RsbU (regulator of sigma subunit)